MIAHNLYRAVIREQHGLVSGRILIAAVDRPQAVAIARRWAVERSFDPRRVHVERTPDAAPVYTPEAL